MTRDRNRPARGHEQYEGSGRRTARNDGRRDEGTSECRCEVTFHGDQLLVDAERCPGAGRLVYSPACRETVIGALSTRDARAVCVRVDDTERACARDVAAFLLAAGRFVALCSAHNGELAARARRDPLDAARLAAGRSDRVTEIAAATGFVEGSVRFASYRAAFGDRDDQDDRGDPGDVDRSDGSDGLDTREAEPPS